MNLPVYPDIDCNGYERGMVERLTPPGITPNDELSFTVPAGHADVVADESEASALASSTDGYSAQGALSSVPFSGVMGTDGTVAAEGGAFGGAFGIVFLFPQLSTRGNLQRSRSTSADEHGALGQLGDGEVRDRFHFDASVVFKQKSIAILRRGKRSGFRYSRYFSFLWVGNEKIPRQNRSASPYPPRT
jgi:hypothetical protein